MKRSLLVLALMGFSAAASAEMVVEDAYVRAPPPGAPAGSAYMVLRNTADATVDLVGAESAAAGKITLHSTMNHGGMMHMMETETVAVPAGGEVVLQSGGMHLMLEQLTDEVVPGKEIELTLKFSDGSSVVVSAPVRSVLDE